MRILIVDYETSKITNSVEDEDFLISEALLEGILIG